MAYNNELEKIVASHRLFDLSDSLVKVQKSVIGVFRLHALQYFEMVIEKDDYTVRTMRVGQFLGLQDSHYALEAGTFVPIPAHFDNLHDLIQKPFEFKAWSDSLK